MNLRFQYARSLHLFVSRLGGLTCFVGLVGLADLSNAQVLIDDNFETDSSLSYTLVDDGSLDSTRVFAYDYVAAGFPLAPRSEPGDLGGLLVNANEGA